MDQGQPLENEIFTHCIECHAERLMAYWDEELECYIYLCDEKPVCNGCMSNKAAHSSLESLATA